MNLASMTRYRFRQTWYQFWAIVRTLNRQAELVRLTAWAYRKRLHGPMWAYIKRSRQEEELVLYYAIRFTRLLRLARWLHRVSNLISPTPRFPTKGSAAFYRNQRPHRAARA